VDVTTVDIDATTITETSTGTSTYNPAGTLTLVSTGADVDIDASTSLTMDSGTTMDLTSGSNMTLETTGGGTDITLDPIDDLIVLASTTDINGTLLDVDVTTIDLDSTAATTINSGTTMGLTSGTTMGITSGDAMTLTSGGGDDINITSGNDVIVTATITDINGTELNVDTTLTDINSTTVDIDSSTITATATGSSTYETSTGTMTIQTTGSGNMTIDSADALTVNSDTGMTLTNATSGNITLNATSGIGVVSVDPGIYFPGETANPAATAGLSTAIQEHTIWLDTGDNDKLKKRVLGVGDRPFVMNRDNSSAANRLAIYSDATGYLIEDTTITATSGGNMTIPGTLGVTGVLTSLNTGNQVAANNLIFGDNGGTATLVPTDLTAHGMGTDGSSTDFIDGQMIWLETAGTDEFKLTNSPSGVLTGGSAASPYLTYVGGVVEWRSLPVASVSLQDAYDAGDGGDDGFINLDNTNNTGIIITNDSDTSATPLLQVRTTDPYNLFSVDESSVEIGDTSESLDFNIYHKGTEKTSWYGDGSVGTPPEIVFRPSGGISSSKSTQPTGLDLIVSVLRYLILHDSLLDHHYHM